MTLVNYDWSNRIVVVDTNIVFSALLNPSSKFADVLLKPETLIKFYSSTSLVAEIENHKNKIKRISSYSDSELQFLIRILISRISFFEPNLIPLETLTQIENLCADIDINDTEFVALAEHTGGVLWTGDKKLMKGLVKKGWNRFITTEELLKS